MVKSSIGVGRAARAVLVIGFRGVTKDRRADRGQVRRAGCGRRVLELEAGFPGRRASRFGAGGPGGIASGVAHQIGVGRGRAAGRPHNTRVQLPGRGVWLEPCAVAAVVAARIVRAAARS
jgi:hypothetical protein